MTDGGQSQLFLWVILTKVFAILSCILCGCWFGIYQGGFTWLTFNFHPLFFTIGFMYVYGDGMLLYKVFPNSPKMRVKIAHGLLNATALIFMLIAAIPVFQNPNKMYSLHSWIGLGTVILFALQWVMSFVTFLFPGLAMHIRSMYKPVHVFWGMVFLATAATSIVTGITQRTSSISGYTEHSSEGLLANFYGMCTIATVICTVFILTNPAFDRPISPEEEHIPIN